MGVTKSTKLAALISIILATTAFLVAATTQPVSYAKITEDQAITIILSNPRVYSRIVNGTSQSTELRQVTLSWINQLKDMGRVNGSRIYVSKTPFNNEKLYWVLTYETKWGSGWDSGNGTYIVDAQTGELMISLESQSHIVGSHPPDIPIEYTYGLQSNITSAVKLWVNPPLATSLSQPTWIPEGMNQTAVYLLNSNVVTHTGKITQVTTLYSYKGIRDPWTAEVQLRVQMASDLGWLDPHPGMELGIGGNYTTINGYPAYAGLIGWFEGGYADLYGGTARIVSVRIGYVLYVFRAPENIPLYDIIQMASSLKQVTSEHVEVKVETEGFGYPYRLLFTDESTNNTYEGKMTDGSINSVNGTFVFDTIPAGLYVPYIYYHELGLPLTSGTGGVTSGAAMITVTDEDRSISISVGPGYPNHVPGP